MSSVKDKFRVFVPTEQSGTFIMRLCRLTDHIFAECAAKLGTKIPGTVGRVAHRLTQELAAANSPASRSQAC